VTGFLKKAGTVKCADVEIQSRNDYVTVLVVAMDDKPLRSSGKILVQVGTMERPLGWKTRPAQVNGRAAEEVMNFGHVPWMIVNGDVTLALRNTKITRARVLDANGMPAKEVPLTTAAGLKTLKFPANALYAVLQ
jgi:vancomycin permeability regulator SanA